MLGGSSWFLVVVVVDVVAVVVVVVVVVAVVVVVVVVVVAAAARREPAHMRKEGSPQTKPKPWYLRCFCSKRENKNLKIRIAKNQKTL